MRLIDATDAEKWVREHILDAAEKYIILGLLGACSTVEAIIPVRCKDCHYGKTWKNAFGNTGFRCDLLCMDLSPNDFCSYGERRCE